MEYYFDGLIQFFQQRITNLEAPFEDKKGVYKRVMARKADAVGLSKGWNEISDPDLRAHKLAELNKILNNDIKPAARSLTATKDKVDTVVDIIKGTIEQIKEKKKIMDLTSRQQKLVEYTEEQLQTELTEFFDGIFKEFRKFPEIEAQIREIRIEMVNQLAEVKDIDEMADALLRIEEETKILAEV